MTVKDQLNEALKNAMKDHDEEKKLTYRMALAAIKFAEKEGQKEVSDEEALELVQREIKIRREQIADAEKSARFDSIPAIQNEIAWLEAFLPRQLSEAELQVIIEATAAEIGVSGPKDMGGLMKAVLPKVRGVAANNVVSQQVRKYLDAK
ncbi:hypothetical protein BEQ56_10185 [Anaerolineaceae bacterium oral taxon 439]|nr:hypothetical protein BEQ56_10185 [Anaerolineaceae bacterium oral taxon 439]